MFPERIEKIKEIASDLDWSVNVNYENNYYEMEFYKFSPLGEDFNFCVFNKDADNLIHDICDYVDEFDPEEHACMWYQAARYLGLRNLLDDADKIQEMMDELIGKLKTLL